MDLMIFLVCRCPNKYLGGIIHISHSSSTQYGFLLKEKKNKKKKLLIPWFIGTWGCTCRLRPGPATHDVMTRQPSNWQVVFDRRRGLNPSPNQSQRSFMPCGQQCDTPPNSRKQTIEKAQNCCEIVTLHQIRLLVLLKGLFAKHTRLICRTFLNNTPARARRMSSLCVFQSWLVKTSRWHHLLFLTSRFLISYVFKITYRWKWTAHQFSFWNTISCAINSLSLISLYGSKMRK